MEYLQINENNREVILELFNKAVDKEGFITERKTGKRLLCPYSKQNIKANNFSVLPCSTTFVNNKLYCFAEHLVAHR